YRNASTVLKIPYTAGNAGNYGGESFNSTGVTGLTATLEAGNLEYGEGTFNLNLTGSPSAVGEAIFVFNHEGFSCSVVVEVVYPEITLASLDVDDMLKYRGAVEGEHFNNNVIYIDYTGGT